MVATVGNKRIGAKCAMRAAITVAAYAGSFLTCATPLGADPSLECSITASSQVEVGKCLAEVEDNLIPTLGIVYNDAYAAALELDEITERSVAVPALEASQAAWETYRDAQCDYAGSLFGGGSGTGIAMRACRIELTRDRIRELSAPR